MRIETYHCDLPGDRQAVMLSVIRTMTAAKSYRDFQTYDLSADCIIEQIWNAGMGQ